MSEIKYSLKSMVIQFLFGSKCARNNCEMPKELPIKDPEDYVLTESSTNWETENFCPECKSKTGHKEGQADVCNSCGVLYKGCVLILSTRSWRKIYNGSIWITQYRYKGDKFEIVDDKR